MSHTPPVDSKGAGKPYKVFKNHLHNTLKITKADIREMVEKAVYKVVERRVDVLLDSELTIQRVVDKAIGRKLTQRNMFWGESEDSLDDYIKKEVVDKLLKGTHLKVEVVKSKKAATPTHGTLKIRRTRKANK